MDLKLAGLSIRAKKKLSVDQTKSFLSLHKLVEAKKLAFRRGVWYRALTHLERSAVDLTIRYVDNIKSTQLAKMLTAIITKIQQTTESTLNRLIRTMGTPMAQKVSSMAVNWGYSSASKWADDPCFACYLAVCMTKSERFTFGSS